jgi:hypothetical protein
MYDAAMTPNAQAQHPRGAAPPPGAEPPCDTRLATRIPHAVDQRLRLFAVLRRRPLARVLSDVLGGALPTAEELARQLQQWGGSDDGAS